VEKSQITTMTASIVSAYLANNTTSADQIGSIISEVGAALTSAANPTPPTLANVDSTKRGRNVIRRRAGKVVGAEESGSEESSSEEQNEPNAASSDETSDQSSSDDEKPSSSSQSDWEYDDNGDLKHPEPDFE
jgi:hypothetical protein